ncbi:YjgN family protein [Tenacibaculum sp. 190524A05c]|uniref:YjgN family protein n=1 Tax=Tenacibaculum platacis TaxID=3137852 RepID=UPI0031FB14E1
MEGFSGLFSDKKQFNYFGKGSEFALIFFKNIFLTIITLGIYYPWAKVELLQYHYKSTEIEKNSFVFHGTGKEVFTGFLKVYAVIFLFYAFLFYGTFTDNPKFTGITVAVFYLLLILLIPFAIHGAVKYRSSKSSWKGIHFSYLGDKMELFWKCIIGTLLTILTLGIYGAWFSVDLRKYIFSHLRFGNLSFDFEGKGDTLFWINLKFFFLFYLTLGIYTIWYIKELYSYYAENTKITQNGRNIGFNFTAKAGDIFELLVVNFLLAVLTLGLATPWIIVRTQTFIFRFIEIEEGLNTDSIQKINYDNYSDASGDSFLDFLELDLL